jgi:glycosyltransferase involved in cell wall biosynthesis
MVQKVVGDLAWEQASNRGWVRDGFEEFQKKRYGFKVVLLKVLRTWWTRQADTVIVPSCYLARWVIQWGVPEERIVPIYNALKPMKRLQTTDLPLSTSIKVVTVGRLVSWKGVDKVLEAVAHCDRVGVAIVGDGPERERLLELAKALSMGDRVYFAGKRRKAETLALMTMCDIFVLNSSYEGFPHVVLEAMSLGLPVVVTAVGGTLEIVQDGENGILIPPEGTSALREALLKLVSSPAERRRLADGAQRTLERFNLSRMVSETEEVLWKASGV